MAFVETEKLFSDLEATIEGEVFYSDLMRTLFATDASIYQELPLGVVFPGNEEDLKILVRTATRYGISLIPRSAGTSLAGQCVGEGLVVDTSKYMTRIIEVNAEEKWVKLQPGVIRDELNFYLESYNLYFGPNTSTSNRCMIGGMVGNNSSGSTSIEYGTTRDNILEVEMILSHGEKVIFKEINRQEFFDKCRMEGLEGELYRNIKLLLDENALLIDKNYPDKVIRRRNQGYALDALLESEVFKESDIPFNFSKLICGSEGTLGIISAVKLKLVPLPDPDVSVVCAHFSTLDEALKATIYAMQSGPSKCELMDKTVLDCTKENKEQALNRKFVVGDPAAVLIIEFRNSEILTSAQRAANLIRAFKENLLGYAFPVLKNTDASRVWNLRAAGLGVLSNVKGNAKPIACIEDTAVRVEDLPDYIRDFQALLDIYKQKAVFYAHAGAGELHLRPLIDLKTKEGMVDLYNICHETTLLVKKYNGTISGEHGDGRVRSPFLKTLVGEEVVVLWENLKRIWDPKNVFNPNKIVFPNSLTDNLRYRTGEDYSVTDTVFDFSEEGSMILAVEKCNGSGDCRKTAKDGGTMCPSYKATLNEKDTTRARANALRIFMKKNESEVNFDSADIVEVLDLCLSCKACISECPSSVDMAKYKSEYLYQYYKSGKNKRRRSDFFIVNFYNLYKTGTIWPGLFNKVASLLGPRIKKMAGFHAERSLPPLSNRSFNSWLIKNTRKIRKPEGRKVYLFIDEFIDLLEAEIGIYAVRLLNELGYSVEFMNNKESGRAAISKGALDHARKLAGYNVNLFSGRINAAYPLIGIEPSSILTFRDEYPKLLRGKMQREAVQIASHTYTIEEFLYKEFEAGRITADRFDERPRKIKYHMHCHQKSLTEGGKVLFLLSLPKGHIVENIPSGCCGMAGSFGFEEEHFEISQRIGEEVLFPAVRNSGDDEIICASGTSCRHQILDGTQRKSYHPVEILYGALIKK